MLHTKVVVVIITIIIADDISICHKFGIILIMTKLLWKVFCESNTVQPREFSLGQVPQNKLKERKP